MRGEKGYEGDKSDNETDWSITDNNIDKQISRIVKDITEMNYWPRLKTLILSRKIIIT